MLLTVIFLTVYVVFFSYGSAFSDPAAIEIEWSHRQVAHVTVNPDIPEGSLFVTFSSDQNIYPSSSIIGIDPITPTTWRLNLAWDNLSPSTVSFTNAADETTFVDLVYSPRMPLTPLDHDLSVLNVITSPENLWDSEIGIYCFGTYDNCLQYGEDWERPAVFQFFENSNSPALSEQVGIRINGNSSRVKDQKSLRFYFDDYGTDDEVDFDFFDCAPSSFQRLLIRNGRWPSQAINSIFAENLFIELGNLGSRHRDMAVYLNNEYWGFYTLRERIDSKFIEETHNLDSGGYTLIKDGSVIEGVPDPWWDFLDSCREDHDFSSHQWFSYVTDNLDLHSYMDWLIINIFGATGDNGGTNNVSVFQHAQAPWQFIMYDEDAIFLSENLNADFFCFFSIANEAEYHEFRPPTTHSAINGVIRWAGLFRSLIQNSEFKILFKERFEELLANELSGEALIIRLNNISDSQSTEMERHHSRWGQSSNTYASYINYVSNWVISRRIIILNQFDAFLENYRAPVELSLFGAEKTSDNYININWRTESEENCLGFVLYRGPSIEMMTPIASYITDDNLVASGDIWQREEYDFEDRSSNMEYPLYYQLAIVDQEGFESLLPWIIEISPPPAPPTLVINEFLAINDNGIQDETGANEDWMEIFNFGSSTVNLEGLYLTDDLTETTKWEIPSIEIEPGCFLLVWCDSDPEDGPLHTNFKISGSGETLAIFDTQASDNQLVDCYSFGPQTADISEGRLNDGGEFWGTFETPTPGCSNQLYSAIPELMPLPFSLGPSHPNPFNPSTMIQFSLNQPATISIDVYDINGRKIRTLLNTQIYPSGQYQINWDGTDDQGRALASGTYFARASMGNKNRVLKLSLIK